MSWHELNVKLADIIIHPASSFHGPTCGNCLVAAFTSLKLQASVPDQFWAVPTIFNHYLGLITTEYLLVIAFCSLILGLLFFIVSFFLLFGVCGKGDLFLLFFCEGFFWLIGWFGGFSLGVLLFIWGFLFCFALFVSPWDCPRAKLSGKRPRRLVMKHQ